MLIFYLFKTTRKVMKIIHHTDSGMQGKTESLVSKETNVSTKLVCGIRCVLFTIVLTLRSLFCSKTEKCCVSFVL